MLSRKVSLVAAVLAGFAMTGSIARASLSLAVYPMAGGAVAPSSVSSNITAGNIGFGSNASDYTGSGTYLGLQLSGQRLTESAAAPDSFYQVTLTPNAGQAMNVTSLSVYDQYTSDPDSYFTVRSSLDGDVSDLVTPTQIGFGSTTTVTLGSAFSSLSSPVTFEVIGWNTAGDTNTIGYFKTLTVNGTTSAVPEPASSSLLGIGAVALLGRRRRMA